MSLASKKLTFVILHLLGYEEAMSKFTDYRSGPKAGGMPHQIVLLLHGVGSNGQDLIGLAPYWAHALPRAIFISPDAPFPCDMAPGMPNSYQWFSLQSRDSQDMRRGIKEAQPLLDSYIDSLLNEFSLGADKLALVGFSQGTMMSLYVGPRRKDKIAGILGYSGALLGAEDLGGENIQKMSICLIHGEADDVIPIEAYHMARQTLEQNGFEVSGHTSAGLTHSIDEKGIEEGAKFLSQIFV